MNADPEILAEVTAHGRRIRWYHDPAVLIGILGIALTGFAIYHKVYR